jgi:hypothetical protein
MKSMILAAVLIITFSTASFARKFVAEGKTFSALGNYKIELADNPFTINGEDNKAYVISYENSKMEVTVIVMEDRKDKKYIVLSDMLSVQYVCNEKYFGVEKLDKIFEKDGYKTSDSALNRSEYFHQKALSSGESCKLDNTRLIAAYFPMLINNFDDIVAAR